VRAARRRRKEALRGGRASLARLPPGALYERGRRLPRRIAAGARQAMTNGRGFRYAWDPSAATMAATSARQTSSRVGGRDAAGLADRADRLLDLAEQDPALGCEPVRGVARLRVVGPRFEQEHDRQPAPALERAEPPAPRSARRRATGRRARRGRSGPSRGRTRGARGTRGRTRR